MFGNKKKEKQQQVVMVEFDESSWVNNLNRTELKKAIRKMEKDESIGKDVPVAVKATWGKGMVTGVNGKMVCHAPPEIQLLENDGDVAKGPSVHSYCPLIAGGCFVLILMMHAARKDYHFEEVTANMATHADMIGFYKKGWEGTKNKDGSIVQHPWADGIKLGIIIRSGKSQDKLNDLADHANKHCPSSEIMKRDLPVDVEKFVCEPTEEDNKEIDWDAIPVYNDMDKYNEIAQKDSHMVQQEANMTWHVENENALQEDALMTFQFPHDNNSGLELGFDPPIGRESPYVNLVQACFFGGLSSLLHSVACRIDAHGYKVAKIDGVIKTQINKRKVLGVESDTWVFPVGASIEISVVSNAPKELLGEIQKEAEAMSTTMMNWREELPFLYGVARAKPQKKRTSLEKPKEREIGNADSSSSSTSSVSSGFPPDHSRRALQVRALKTAS
jgi:uncharacterized OsmC-like protein